MLQPYDPCPCGSGKKFKWCCQAIYADIRRAQEQFEQGQQETALRLIDQVVKAHPDNPEAWGNKAMLLARSNQIEAAEEALEAAFKINPNYPTGLLMRAQFRMNEGELPGALLLARRAAEAFDPEAHDYLAQVFHIIFEAELSLQRIPAAHAALGLTVRYAPAVEQLRQVLDGYFGPDGPLPEVARKHYVFRSPAQKALWEANLAEVPPSRLGALAKLCEEVATADEKDAAAWFNLAVARAWIGDHAGALVAAEKSLALETDDALGRETAGLGEVLRMGLGMEAHCDHLQAGFGCQVRNAQAASTLLREWHAEGRLLVQPSEEEGLIVALVLDIPKAIVTAEAAKPDQGTFAAHLQIIQQAGVVRMRGPNRASVERLRDTLREKLGLPANEAEISITPMPFSDIILSALAFPTGPQSGLTMERVKELARKYFVEQWIQQPLKSLAGNTPIDAAASPALKRRLAGVVDFLAQCCDGPYLNQADFNVLRHKLGLEPVEVEAVVQVEAETPPTPVETPTPTPTPTPTGTNIPRMNAAELAALDVAALGVPQLTQAHQTALKLDAKELAKHFGETLIARPADADKNDRFSVYSYLILRALADGDADRAIALAEAGSVFDADHNAAGRRDDFDLRKGQAHLKKGDPDQAGAVFGPLLERSPDNLKLRIEIIETLLRLKQGKLALQYIESGIERAKDRLDRDAEGHLSELAASARKLA